MANLLVLVETQRGGAPRPVCLEALGRAREIGTQLGASVYAAVLLGRPPTEELLTQLSTGGADRILLAESPEFDGCFDDADFQSHGPALKAVAARVAPALVLFGAGLGAWELAPRLAASLGAVFLPDVQLLFDEKKLRLADGGGAALDGDVEEGAVGIVAPGRYRVAVDGDEAEVEVVRLPTAESATPLAPVERVQDARGSVVLGGALADDTALKTALGERVGTMGGRLALTVAAPALGAAPTRVVIGAEVTWGAQLAFDGPAGALSDALARALANR